MENLIVTCKKDEGENDFERIDVDTLELLPGREAKIVNENTFIVTHDESTTVYILIDNTLLCVLDSNPTFVAYKRQTAVGEYEENFTMLKLGKVLSSGQYGLEDDNFLGIHSGYLCVINWCTNPLSIIEWFPVEDSAISRLQEIADEEEELLCLNKGYYPSVDLTRPGCVESRAYVCPAKQYFK